ncbi:PREDICTED: glucuronoxylan 4-O-methyltransferase 3-like [Camelina sativa]|uniref:Glucuronoxylan 4-O-methyltransferase 3-like n=1 Tax=Camelina sativa TaxID=90675 RepID=A0ABM0TL47_CAMSA|nr:PREDICTED: glucuronoxylan 4-O-methyltransferase 3-like [Camelina sativa]
MTTNLPFSITLKHILSSFASLVLLTLFIITRTSFSPSSSVQPHDNNTLRISNSSTGTKSHSQKSASCNKIPPSLADALIHYAASNVTPQQTHSEISVTKKVLEKKSPCNFLVFGLGYDSLMWSTLNYGGRTIFLEENESWIRQIAEKFPSLESYHVRYNTKVSDADALMAAARDKEECHSVSMDPRVSACDLALKGLPDVVYETEWDLIMVDAPTGFHEEAPGRMTAIYTAGLIARRRKDEGETTDVFLHDVDRKVEDEFSMAFLCRDYLTEQEGRLRHFTVPSHRDYGVSGGTFCP